jgi:hypothetical protein
MYLVLLAQGNTEFRDTIRRKFPQSRSARLEAVLNALTAAQGGLDLPRLTALHTALTTWQTQDPKEFTNRSGTNGVFYRLLIEVRQVARNNFSNQLPGLDPIMPPDCPGDVLIGVYVPAGEGHTEICHGFAYRWAVAAGKLKETGALSTRPNTAYNGESVANVLYPAGFNIYPPARVNGVIQVQPGDLIGMFAVPAAAAGVAALGHSLIAETPTTWFSANNAGTFATGTGRSRIDTAGAFPAFAGHQVGWIGNGNQWMRPDGQVLHVVYRRF